MPVFGAPTAHLSRRRFLRGGVGLLGAAAFPTALQGLIARGAQAGHIRQGGFGYGEPVPAIDAATGLPLLRLPPGFVYRSMSWTGDPMSDGRPTPTRHDGMAVVQVLSNRSRDLVLIRNHEETFGPAIGGGVDAPIYDDVNVGTRRAAGGGTTTLVFRRGELISVAPSLGGTAVNCAGGPTPWGSWLSCEEAMLDARFLGGLVHGYVFEVPAPALGPASAEPIRDMGLFRHEAVAIDPTTGFAYLTEDTNGRSGFYRYRPDDPSGGVGSLARGGTLEMLAVVDEPGADLSDPELGATYEVGWAAIDEPDLLPPAAEGQLFYDGDSGPFGQGRANGAAKFRRLEGCWYGNGALYFVDTTGGDARLGSVWCYEPPAVGEAGGGRLTALFVSADPADGNNLDNLTVSPRGGLLCCEDASQPGNRLVGIAPDGSSFPFAVNQIQIDEPLPGHPDVAVRDYSSFEWCGACFDPTGTWLFANIQQPGVTFAISGPWNRGLL